MVEQSHAVDTLINDGDMDVSMIDTPFGLAALCSPHQKYISYTKIRFIGLGRPHLLLLALCLFAHVPASMQRNNNNQTTM